MEPLRKSFSISGRHSRVGGNLVKSKHYWAPRFRGGDSFGDLRSKSNAILNISHVTSHENPAIQAVDLFCWGIAKKHTLGEKSWYDCFKESIIFEEVYLPDKK